MPETKNIPYYEYVKDHGNGVWEISTTKNPFELVSKFRLEHPELAIIGISHAPGNMTNNGQLISVMIITDVRNDL
ncbi:MAG: hypothetical protein HGA31_04885 [Candidatus Moranbacteria bacterium]|nr:hypothetical protein [Candidatus Moranbacteria bacterium]